MNKENKVNIIIDLRIVHPDLGGGNTYIKCIFDEIRKSKEWKKVNVIVIGNKKNNNIIKKITKITNIIYYKYDNGHPIIRYFIDFIIHKKINLIKGKKVYWAPFNTGVPNNLKNITTVITLHDLLVYDIPEFLPLYKRIGRKWGLNKSIKYADKIICVSNFTRERLLYNFKDRILNKDIYVNKEGVSIKNKKIYMSMYEHEYMLFVGYSRKQKNISFLIEVFSKYKKKYHYDGKLIIAGNMKNKIKKYKKETIKHNVQNDVIFLGYVDDDTLNSLYSNCDIFLFPSIYEGFGLPILEAASHGIIVVTSNIGAMREVGYGNGFLANPYNVNDFVEKINNAKNRKEFIAINIESEYSWRNHTSNLLKILLSQ